MASNPFEDDSGGFEADPFSEGNPFGDEAAPAADAEDGSRAARVEAAQSASPPAAPEADAEAPAAVEAPAASPAGSDAGGEAGGEAAAPSVFEAPPPVSTQSSSTSLGGSGAATPTPAGADGQYTCCQQTAMAWACCRRNADACTTAVAASRKGTAALSLFMALAATGVLAYSILWTLPFNWAGDCPACGDELSGDTASCVSEDWFSADCAAMFGYASGQLVQGDTCTDAASGEAQTCECSCYTGCAALAPELRPIRLKLQEQEINEGEPFYLGCPMPDTVNALRFGGAGLTALWLAAMAVGVLCITPAHAWLLAASGNLTSGIALLFLFAMGLDSQAVAQSQAACDADFVEGGFSWRSFNLDTAECELFPFAWFPVMDIALAGLAVWTSAVFVTRYKLQGIKAALQAAARSPVDSV